MPLTFQLYEEIVRQLIKSKLLGGALLIAGTTLGAGMLAFPTGTSFGGFIPSTILFLLIWGVMLISSFCLLDANLSMKGETNMISMAEKTLGMWGKLFAWVIYLFLLYSLAAAYIAGCIPLFVEAIATLTGYTVPHWLFPFVFPTAFGGFIYFGTRCVDLFNRVLMIGLIIAYFFLVFFVPNQVHFERLSHIDFPAIAVAIPIVITAFGYHIVIPSLSTYMNRDKKMLTKAILIGSVIPILVYLFWQTLVLGAVPLNDLIAAYKKGSTATQPLAQVVENPLISIAAKLFAFFAIATSFIGITMSLADFLTDGFKIKRSHFGRVLAIALTFFPPLFFVYVYQRGFYMALQYAGAFVAILLVLLPAAMVWKLKKYRSFGGRLLLIALAVIAFGVVILDILQETGKLDFLIKCY
jgi:tyrosine-specific transport protein